MLVSWSSVYIVERNTKGRKNALLMDNCARSVKNRTTLCPNVAATQEEKAAIYAVIEGVENSNKEDICRVT